MPMVALSLPVVVPVVAGALYAVANLVKLFTKPNTVAFKVANKVLTLGPDLVNLFGMESALAGGSPTPPTAPPAA
jgi:hypothetical protein